jgi:hypothetical protein
MAKDADITRRCKGAVELVSGKYDRNGNEREIVLGASERVPGRGAPSSPRAFAAPFRASGLDRAPFRPGQGLGSTKG